MPILFIYQCVTIYLLHLAYLSHSKKFQFDSCATFQRHSYFNLFIPQTSSWLFYNYASLMPRTNFWLWQSNDFCVRISFL